MDITYLWIPIVFAVLDWIAVARGSKPLELFAKPAVMASLLVWMFTAVPDGAVFGPWWWFILGIFFSMLGDIFLMLPKEQFIAGLVAFLVAHVMYVIGLNQQPPPLNVASAIIVLVVSISAGRLFRRLSTGLREKGHTALLRPVLVYSVVITLMLVSALFTLVHDVALWTALPAIFVSVGAFLFYVSDAFLAWNRFVVPLSYGKLRVIVTYHLGQILLVLGAGIFFFGLQ